MGPDIFELKHQGHGLIDELVLRGIPRHRVYKQLREKLGVQDGFEHFARMSTISQVERAIRVLREMRNERRRSLKKRKSTSQPKVAEKKSTAQKDVLPLTEQKRILAEVAEKNRRKRVPLFIRIWRTVTT